MFLLRRAVWEGSLPLSIASPLPTSPSTPTDSTEQSTDETRGAKRKLVPESMIPEIIKKVHGSRRKLSRLMNEILQDQQDPSLRPSKRCLADKIRGMAVWERNPEIGHHCWFVKEEFRQSHNLMDILIKPLNTQPLVSTPPSTNITKFTKVLTSDERLKLLREVPSASSTLKESPSIAAVSKLSSVPTKQLVQAVKTPTIKQLFAGNSKPVTKKRVPLLVSVPPGQSISKQTPSTTITNLDQSNVTPSEIGKESPSSSLKDRANTDKKAKRRITPIMLTTVVAKPPLVTHLLPPPLQEECIVLSD